MKEVSEPGFINATPPNRDEASFVARLCLEFELRHSEGRMLGWLLTHDYCTKEELRAAASHNDQVIALGTAGVFVSTLRKKLKPHGIHIVTISGLGYALEQKVREKVRKRLAKHNVELIPERSRSKPEAEAADQHELHVE
jgi:DNA-binding winged helix-turn-helix (wHTH) protein